MMVAWLRSLAPLVPVLAASLVSAAPTAPATPAGRVDVEVRVENLSRDRKGETTKRTLRLDITLTNPTRTDLSGHRMIWKIVGRNVASRKAVLLGMGTESVSLKAGEEKLVHTSAASISETDDRLVSSGKSNSRTKNRPMKTIPASGEEYRGYFVEVYDGANRLVGSAYSPGMKEDAADLFKRPAAPAKKGKK